MPYSPLNNRERTNTAKLIGGLDKLLRHHRRKVHDHDGRLALVIIKRTLLYLKKKETVGLSLAADQI